MAQLVQSRYASLDIHIVVMDSSVLCYAVVAICPKFVQVPQGHVWLQGDNTLNSTDSRHYGPVPYALLSAKAVAKVGA